MQKGNISVQTENIFPIIKKFLYSDQEIFLRELVSNAVDATTKIKTLSSSGEFNGELGDLTIDIILDKENKTLTISDKGIGMSEEEVNKYLNQVAFSSAEDFLQKYKTDSGIIGHFGLGFYSAFMVAYRVEVVTKSFREEEPAVNWSCDGNPEYEITPAERAYRGTDIILHISEDAVEYLEDSRIESLLNKYCKFLPVPVRFGKRTETTWEGEGEDKKSIQNEVDNIINATAPLWKKKPSELSDEDYKNFYNELYPFSTSPLFWIHLNIDFPFNLTGILYFPKLSNGMEMQKNKIQLYSNQVYVTDEVKDIVPEFLTMLHGVIDSPDIPLNVSRSYLQADSNVKKITSYITKKVADKLESYFKNDKDAFVEKWNDVGVFVKYGMITDEKFYEKAEKFALVKNIDDQYFTLSEYKDKIKENQTDKHNKQVFIYTTDRHTHHNYIDSAKSNSFDVLQMDQMIDPHFMQHLEYKMNDIVFVRVDSDTTDQLVQKDEKKQSVLSEKEQEQLKGIFDSVLASKSEVSLVFKALSPDDFPVTITRPEFMRRMKEMQLMQGMDPSMFPDTYQLVVNTNHPIIADKLLKVENQSDKEDMVHYLHQLALLNQNMLRGEELGKFLKRSISMI
jgi:molecular chaperone HtpG